MSLIGKVSVDGEVIEQYILKSEEDVNKYLEEFPKMKLKLLSLEETFKNIVAKGGVVLLSTEENMAGFYSWRTAGKENWIVL